MPSRRCQVAVVGLSHVTAPLPLRERVACTPECAAALIAGVAPGEGFVLSTCNRVEAYVADGDAHGAAERLLAALAARAGVDPETLAPHAYVHVGEAAVRHACRVAAGLESMVVGEAQIGGQLRRAAHRAQETGTVGPVLHRLVGTALAAGRRARARLAPGAAPASLAEAAVRAVGGTRALGGLRVLVIGAGEIGIEVLRAMGPARPRALVVANRSATRAADLAARHHARVAEWERLADAVAEADVIVAATAAPRAVVSAALLAGAEERDRTFVDLGVPRNVHEDVRQVPGARVLDVDALRFWSGAGVGVDARAAATGRSEAEEEVERWVARFASWQRSRAHIRVIRRLRDEADELRDAEVARALARLGALSPREREVVRTLASRLVNKMLHHPLVALAAAPDNAALADPARRLFGQDEAPAPCVAAAQAAVLPPAGSGICPVTGAVLPAAALAPTSAHLPGTPHLAATSHLAATPHLPVASLPAPDPRPAAAVSAA